MQSTLHDSCMSWRPARFFENDEQRKQGQRSNQQHLVIVNISNDLRLLRDQGVERRSAGGGKWAQEWRNARILEGAIDRGDVCRDVSMVDLGIGRQQRGEGGNANSCPPSAR